MLVDQNFGRGLYFLIVREINNGSLGLGVKNAISAIKHMYTYAQIVYVY